MGRESRPYARAASIDGAAPPAISSSSFWKESPRADAWLLRWVVVVVIVVVVVVAAATCWLCRPVCVVCLDDVSCRA